jgi:hypothetical protein
MGGMFDLLLFACFVSDAKHTNTHKKLNTVDEVRRLVKLDPSIP